MNRSRPPQQYYKPGSGTLRKSNIGIDETESDTNIVINSKQNYNKNQTTTHVDTKFKSEGNSPRMSTNMDNTIDKLNDMTINKDGNRKIKKPDLEIYVPRVIAQNKKIGHQDVSRHKPDEYADGDGNVHNYSNGNDNNKRYDNSNNDKFQKSKRYSNRRTRDDWNDKTQNRQLRQGSEPRAVNTTNREALWQRRDARSVEPNSGPMYNDKSYTNKPPSGRRHSTIGLERMNEVPPRFRKKMMEEGKFKNLNLQEEGWDGSSLTFQGTVVQQPINYDYHNSYGTLPNTHLQQPNQNIGYATLPGHSRGRGRFHHYDNYNNTVANSRPPTPPLYNNTRDERPNSRPQTPSYNRRNDGSRQSSQERYRKNNYNDNYDRRNNDNRNYNRNYHQKNHHHDNNYRSHTDMKKERDVSPSPPQQQIIEHHQDTSETVPSVTTLDSTIINTDILDWSEEVEQNYKLEAEALSDALTRSSSVASLVESNSTIVPTQLNGNLNQIRKSKRRNGRKNKRRGRSSGRDKSHDRQGGENYYDNFKIPTEPRHRKNSRDQRDSSYERFGKSSRDCSFDRIRRVSTSEQHENWRDEIRTRQEHEKRDYPKHNPNNRTDFSDIRRSRQNSENSQRSSTDLSNIDIKKAGVLILNKNNDEKTVPPSLDHPRYSNLRKDNVGCKTKSLFDPNNPAKPIIVKSSNNNRNVQSTIPDNKEKTQQQQQPAMVDQYGNVCPIWYRENSEEYQLSHYPNMIQDVKRADQEIQYAIHSGIFIQNMSAVETFRQFLRESLQYFLCKDLKFSQTGNIEQHFWKLLYYNIIEILRKLIQEDDPNKEHYKKFVLYLVDEGTQYFESLLKLLEDTYQFQLNDYLGVNQSIPQKGLGFIGLALISAQKIFIFLGDLARYKEQINETSNYGKCRQWYIKAHEINPKNGRPYKQLAVLAVCARRKLDAVYYYMRSLMSSNPVLSTREKLTNLLYENSKKYEMGEKKRREERLERARKHMKEKESENTNLPTSIRRETWIRPDGGKKVHRTTQAVQDEEDSEEENLALLSSVEVNKRFVISYLHVHGKLITKIGMESFPEAAMQMLKEFRALLQHSPLPLPSNRLLQLLALNMFAIDSTQLKDPQLQQLQGYRSEYQERALVISLQMFNLILERCVSLLEEHLTSKPVNINAVSMDAQILLPPIKIWCDWMLCHSSVWNPPPSTQDFKVGTAGDAWSRLANLVNLLGQFDQTASTVFIDEQREGYEQLRLPEDSVLSGFTPLMVNLDQPSYIPKNFDVESAQFVLRLNKLLFFGTEFLCGLEPPVLKLEIDSNDVREYVSVVSTSNSRNSPQSVNEMRIDNEVLMESFSDDEEQEIKDNLINEDDETSSEIRNLLNRKCELERKHKNHQLHMERVKKILSQSVIRVHIDILPKYLVPDTNCFIDHLDRINDLINVPSCSYTVMVSIVVLGELEGLSRGGIAPIPGTRSKLDPDHVKKVGEAARKALAFLKTRHHCLKCVTTKGAIINSTTFTNEDDNNCSIKNDDKILMTCLNLSKIHCREQSREQQNITTDDGEPKKLFREVVLLTDDRNLRVKALSTDVPVRELPDFMKWAGLG